MFESQEVTETHRSRGSICLSRASTWNKASAYFGILPVPRNINIQWARMLITVPTSPRLIAYFKARRISESRLKRIMFSWRMSRFASGRRRSSATRRAEQRSVWIFLATSVMSSRSRTFSTHSSSVLQGQRSQNASRMWAGRVRPRISSQVGWNGGSVLAFHPAEIALRPKSELIFHKDHAHLLLGMPQYSFATIRSAAILT